MITTSVLRVRLVRARTNAVELELSSWISPERVAGALANLHLARVSEAFEIPAATTAGRIASQGVRSSAGVIRGDDQQHVRWQLSQAGLKAAAAIGFYEACRRLTQSHHTLVEAPAIVRRDRTAVCLGRNWTTPAWARVRAGHCRRTCLATGVEQCKATERSPGHIHESKFSRAPGGNPTDSSDPPTKSPETPVNKGSTRTAERAAYR